MGHSARMHDKVALTGVAPVPTAGPEPDRASLLESAFELLPVGIYTCDADGLITSFNRRAAELWGREPALRSPTDRYCGAHRLLALDGTEIDVERSWMALTLQTGESYGGREGLVERPDGERIRVLSDAAPIHDEYGCVSGAVSVLVDVETVRGCGSILDGTEPPPHSSLAALAHGLRNPLAPIRNAVRVLRHGTLPDEARAWALDTIDAQLQHMTKLIDQLVDRSEPPRAEPKPAAQRVSGLREADLAAKTSLRVLVVDDNRAVATSFERLLRLFGHEVCVAHDGFEALRVTPQFRPDIALLDLGLPRMDGFELARLLRGEKQRSELLLVAVTGWGDESFRHRAREAGFDHHLVKPVDPDALLELVSKYRPQLPS